MPDTANSILPDLPDLPDDGVTVPTPTPASESGSAATGTPLPVLPGLAGSEAEPEAGSEAEPQASPEAEAGSQENVPTPGATAQPAESEAASSASTAQPTPEPAPAAGGLGLPGVLLGVVIGAAVAGIAAACLLRRRTAAQKPAAPLAPTAQPPAAAAEGAVGKVHHIGVRPGQQDSLGVTETPAGTFAVVADGMGGLADGDKVSQKVVLTLMQDAMQLRPGQTARCLFPMVAHANREINRMLGAANQYKSGSTLIAALVEQGSFQWVSVGDSRIYLYRNGSLLQLNQEHTYETELLVQVANGEISLAEARQHPRRKGLTSFIGMGELKYVDGALRPVASQPGDRLLLMSDGVFNTLREAEIAAILAEAPDAARAAASIQAAVLAHNAPKQDNFTAIVLEL